MKQHKKPKIGLVFGGYGQERSISCISAQAIWKNIDLNKFEAVAIAWSRKGVFYVSDDISKLILNADDPQTAEVNENNPIMDLETLKLDLIFPITHGVGGEDGKIQGFFEAQGLKVIGAGVLASALTFHKGMCKKILAAAGLPIVPGIELTRGKVFFDTLKVQLPCFVKPAESGSSLGVHRVDEEGDFPEAMEDAWVECKDILIETAVEARELECAYLLGQASGVGEIKTSHSFYSWDAKYVDPQGAEIILEADLPEEVIVKIQDYTVQACDALKIKDLARVDFFYEEKTGKVYINEINTLPGFTSISMFPQLWENAGVSFKEQISRLIQKYFPLAAEH
jgi:D-alanine-D-alanine ligase